MRVIEKNFPEAGASLSPVHPLLVGGINVIRYIQNWPGKGNTISCSTAHILNVTHEDRFILIVLLSKWN